MNAVLLGMAGGRASPLVVAFQAENGYWHFSIAGSGFPISKLSTLCNDLPEEFGGSGIAPVEAARAREHEREQLGTLRICLKAG